MNRDAGDVNRRHYHVVKDGRAEGRSWQRWDQAWADVTKRARLELGVAWRVLPCPPPPGRLPRPRHSLNLSACRQRPGPAGD